MRPLPVPAPTRTCLICSGRTTNAFYGVDACRACASFYKRALTKKKLYVCRIGDGQCTYKKHQKYTCRRCRLDACVALGMRLDLDDSRPSTSSACPSPEDSIQKETLLDRIGRLYESYIERRSRGEHALRATARYRQLVTISETTGELIVSPVEFEHEVTPIASTIFIVFLQKAFPEFNELSQPEQIEVFKNALSPVLILESFHFTYKHFPKQPNRFYMMGPTSAQDRDRPEDFLPEDLPCAVKKELAKNMAYYYEKSGKIVDPVMRNANLSETEFVALVALLIWTLKTIVDLGIRMKRAVFCDLSRYYREEGNEAECSTRIGTIMTIIHAIQQAAGVMEEEIQIYALLELFEENCYVKKAFAVTK